MEDQRPNNRRVQEKLIEAALVEFTEKGYDKANLRDICARAGVTTGALYFFFKNKEDLFNHVVDPTVKAMEEYENLLFTTSGEFTDDDLKRLSDFIYENQAGLRLLLCSSQKTLYENYNDRIIENAGIILKKVAARGNINEFTEEFTSVVAKCAEATVKDVISHDYDRDTVESLVRKIYICIKGILAMFVDYKKKYFSED